jgi:hypothetical protein
MNALVDLNLIIMEDAKAVLMAVKYALHILVALALMDIILKDLIAILTVIVVVMVMVMMMVMVLMVENHIVKYIYCQVSV